MGETCWLAGGSGLGPCSGVSLGDTPLSGDVGRDIGEGEDIVVRVEGKFTTERGLYGAEWWYICLNKCRYEDIPVE